MSKLRDQLRAKGPLPSSEAPYSPNTSDKQYGVWTFKPSLQNPNKTSGIGGKPTPVYYLKDEHDPEEVVRTWCEANRRNVETAPVKALTNAFNVHGSEFREAWDAIRLEVLE
jgi:hypothetical protein